MLKRPQAFIPRDFAWIWQIAPQGWLLLPCSVSYCITYVSIDVRCQTRYSMQCLALYCYRSSSIQWQVDLYLPSWDTSDVSGPVEFPTENITSAMTIPCRFWFSLVITSGKKMRCINVVIGHTRIGWQSFKAHGKSATKYMSDQEPLHAMRSRFPHPEGQCIRTR